MSGLEIALIGSILASAAVSGGSAYMASEGQKNANSDNQRMAMNAMGNDWNLMQWQKAVEQDFALQQHSWDIEAFGRESEFNAQQAALNRIFQNQMSNSAYQRSMADMKAAGLNPLLAYQQGGASTPGGATASASAGNTAKAHAPVPKATPVARIENAMGPYASSGQQIAGLVSQLPMLAAQVSNMDETNNLLREQQALTRAQTTETGMRTITEKQRPEFVRAQTGTELGRPDLNSAQAVAARAAAGDSSSREALNRQEHTNVDRYGRPGPVANAGVTAENVVRRVGPALRDAREGIDSTARGVANTWQGAMDFLRRVPNPVAGAVAGAGRYLSSPHSAGARMRGGQ